MATPNPPDVFRFLDGRPVGSREDWRLRRTELLDQIMRIEYGRLPPAPALVHSEELHSHGVARFADARHAQYRLSVAVASGPIVQFILDLLIPAGPGPFPVVLTGDACWRYASDEVALAVLGRRNILATFNRCELAVDNGSAERNSGLYPLYPDHDFGAIAAWAWGYHRCVDFLLTRPFVDPARIAITGHSRGGKAVLLAGALDERIAVTNPNNSGCGGAGSFRFQGADCEKLARIVTVFPHWFGPHFKDFAGRENELPFDQHSLAAAVAPRALLATEALGDLWANPTGTWQTYLAAREVYRFLDVPDRIGIHFRPGSHGHTPADWITLLDFLDWQFHGKRPLRAFDVAPAAPSC